MKKVLLAFTTLFSISSLADVSNLLITELAVTPTNGEFVEIYNNGATPVDLSDVYLTDATFAGSSTYYYQIVLGAGGGGGFADFHARFPDGASIAAGEYQTIALNGSDDFFSVYSQNPTYEIFEDAGSPDSIADMREAVSGSIHDLESGLSGGEVLILYTWDGANDLVQDLDYVLWGDKNEAVDKSGVSIDSVTDADADTSTYASDTSIANQAVIATSQHPSGKSWQRADLSEGVETQSAGNGINGADETSEDLNNTFFEGDPTPNAVGTPPPPTAPLIIINEVDAVGSADFIEIYDGGVGGTSLMDVTVIMYDGATDSIEQIIDLTGNNTDSNGYYLVDGITLNDNVSAVALYFSNFSNFTISDPVTDTNLIDALVYDSGQDDDAGLLTLLNQTGGQIDENADSNASSVANARCPNGFGPALDSSSYDQVLPTPGAKNDECPVLPYYANVDVSSPENLRTSLHNIIRVAESFDYSSSETDTWDVLGFADEDPNPNVDLDDMVAENVLAVYKNTSYVNVATGNNDYNREHTWPQSKGFKDDDMGSNNAARTDAHHLMISNSSYNSERGSKYFDNCVSSCTSLATDDYNGVGGTGMSNLTNGSVFEVWDFRKGDIARAMFYMDVRYEGTQIDPDSQPLQMEPDLTLTNNISDITSGGPYMGLLSTLLQWHIDDPVDNIERLRNDTVFFWQENRNPFVDHPEWVACVFEDDCTDLDLIFQNGFE